MAHRRQPHFRHPTNHLSTSPCLHRRPYPISYIPQHQDTYHSYPQDHQEEEKELFPAVQHSAQAGEERQLVYQLVQNLVSDHRNLEKLWADLEPALKKVSRGQEAQLDVAKLEQLVLRYTEHADTEERVFLP